MRGPFWLTDPKLYKSLDDEFHFDMDPCPYPRPDNYDSLLETSLVISLQPYKLKIFVTEPSLHLQPEWFILYFILTLNYDSP